ncbi:MAG: hypothetical protein GY950_10215, partial [bacterium]|nr:hypothetical protein [bacterium]
GVPGPGAKKSEEKTGEPGTGKPGAREGQPAKATQSWVKMKSRHPDYFKNICGSCHDRSAGNYLKTKKKDLCFTCHKQETFTGKYVHGPVAVRQCLTCHMPHESRYVKLLRSKAPELCYECHMKDSVTTPAPCGRGETCTGCHAPHVSNNRFFVKSAGVPGE